MNQLAMNFEPVRARRSDPATSQRAASRVERFASGHFAKILAALDRAPGSYREIAARAELEPVAVARRMAELETAGLVRRAGEFGGFTTWARA
jgi:predicted Rossmann fold nucleotide-binding protein DprA/Smf involved in DNA uptake